MNKRIDVYLNPPQFKAYTALTDRATLCLAYGRGVGKSWLLRHICWLLVSRWDGVKRKNAKKPLKGVRIVFLVPELEQFKKIHLADLENELADDGAFGRLRGSLNKQDWRITFPGGSWIQIVPATAHRSAFSRGIRCDAVVGDEGDDIDESVYNAVCVPWLSEPWSLAIRCVGGTPRRGRYGLLYKLFDAGRTGERVRSGDDTSARNKIFASYYSFHATYEDVPDFVDPRIVEEAQATSVPAVFKREWKCDFDSAEGLVYGDVFDASFHVRLPPKDQVWSEILIGCDHGWEHPGVFLLIGVIGNGKDAVCWVLDEVYESHQPDSFWKEALKKWLAWYPRALFYGDPSQPKVLDGYRSECKARVQEVDNSVDEGIRSTADRFVVREKPDGSQYTRLFVSPKCENLIRELGLYRRKPDPRNPDAYMEAVDKRNDDACDALRYAIFNRFGPVVATPRGYGSVEARQ